MLLQPTSPLRTRQDIEGAIGLFFEKQADSVISITSPSHHPLLMKTLDHTGRLVNYYLDAAKVTRRQDFPDVYALNGAIYLIKRDILLKNESFYTENTFGFRMPVENSLDIDSPWDMHLAELILKDRLSR